MEAALPDHASRDPKSRGYLAFLTFVAALGGVLFGYHTAVVSGAIVFVQIDFDLRPVGTGWTIAGPLLGAAFGAAIAGVLSFRFGRKPALLIAAVLFLVAAVGSAFVESLFALIVYRIVGGIGVGVASIVSPLYVAEIAPPARRGRLVATVQFAIVSGILISYFVNFAIVSGSDPVWNVTTGWRWMFAAQAVPALLMLGLVSLIPESPRWLVRRDREAEAHGILARINGESFAHAEIAQINHVLHESTNCPKHVYTRGLRRLIWIGVGLAVFQQITGINVFLYFAPTIFESVVGSSADVALLQTIVIGAANLVFTVVAMFTVDHIGRKPLMIIGFVGMSICLFAMSVAIYQQHFDALLLMLLVGYIASFAVSVGPVTWVLLSEMFPTRIRGVAMGVAVACNWIANFVVSQSFPVLVNNAWLTSLFNQAFPFLLYGVFAVVALVFVIRFVPETKGHSLESLESVLRGWQREARQPA